MALDINTIVNFLVALAWFASLAVVATGAVTIYALAIHWLFSAPLPNWEDMGHSVVGFLQKRNVRKPETLPINKRKALAIGLICHYSLGIILGLLLWALNRIITLSIFATFLESIFSNLSSVLAAIFTNEVEPNLAAYQVTLYLLMHFTAYLFCGWLFLRPKFGFGIEAKRYPRRLLIRMSNFIGYTLYFAVSFAPTIYNIIFFDLGRLLPRIVSL